MFFALFALDVTRLGDSFKLYGDEQGEHWQVGLRPRDGGLAQVFEQAVIGGARTVERIELSSAGGDRTEIELSDIANALDGARCGRSGPLSRVNARRRLAAGVLLLAVVGGVFWGWVQPRLRVETDLLDLLPRHSSDQRIEAAVDTFSERLARKVLFLVGAADPSVASAAARAFATSLSQSRAFDSVRERIGQDLQSSVALYLQHRANLLSHQDQETLQKRPDGLYRSAMLALYTPAGLMRPIDISRDPLGLGTDYLLDQVPALGNAHLQGSQLVVRRDTTTFVLVIAETAGSPFAGEVQDRAETAIRIATQAAHAATHDEITFLQSGALQHATLATRKSRSEVALFGTIGTVAVLGADAGPVPRLACAGARPARIECRRSRRDQRNALRLR